METLTFFKRLAKQVKSGDKTATLRDASESHYVAGQRVEARQLEDGELICQLEILAVEPVTFDSLNRQHAKAENLPFVFLLKWIIRRIYPAQTQLYFIRYRVLTAQD
uniref:N(4)-acetylcytidine aminohydrolase n=1 Tax=Thaumasiovibrio occultus TaxID=1891184 RepID=UPI00192CED73|nr:N(4)-acetylcytidine aminohydrolase [Thaumasiovibrio occultus]